MIKILINDSFKKFLIRQPQNYRRKVQQKFEYLEIGYWEGGLKVKRIKSLASKKAVFEARLDRSNRILFTMGAGNEDSASDQLLIIYVWGIVSHDNIASSSKNIPANVPFLQFKPYQQELLDETMLEDLEQSYQTQESITEKVYDDSATQKWHFLNEDNWKRIQNYRDEEFELALYLSPEQKEVLNKPLPIIVSGTAGSGKTTLGVYYLLKLSQAKKKKLFITYNKFLKNSAQRLYQGLLNAAPWKNEFIVPDFYTLKEYCTQVAKGFGKEFPTEKEVDYNRFSRLMLSYSQARKFDTPLIWEEIRSIIKGALPQINLNILKKALPLIEKQQIRHTLLNALQQQFFTFSQLESLKKIEKIIQKYLQTDLPSFSKNMPHYIESKTDRVLSALDKVLNTLQKDRELTQKKCLSIMDYEALGRKKAPNFQFDRKIIYGIFEWYQDQLEREGLWDELDLTRVVLNLLTEKAREEYRYDTVVCDEIQDLADVQHELLFYIAGNPMNLLLSGDTKQIINPSGFRWEELKRHFYERELKIPDIHFLNLNFRSSGSIVELSNILLELKSSLLGSRAEELKEDWKYKGRPPVVVKDLKEPELLGKVQSAGAKKTILVRTEEEKKQLQKILETELIFTIYEAKGLEFDTVLLWKFASDDASRDVWKSILNYSDREVHAAKIKHEINLLYVAITRAQKDLLIYDGKKPSLIWESQAIRDKIYSTEDLTYIGKIWDVISTPEEWREQGDYFYEREFYKAAMECYKNSGEDILFLQANACHAQKIGDFSLAASCFEQTGETEKAALNYEKSGKYDQALRLWKKLKNKQNALRCKLKLLEKEGRYNELGKIYLSQKDFHKAVEILVKGQEYKTAAQVSLKNLNDQKNAAYYYEKAELYQEAASLYLKLKKTEKAAGLYEKAQDFDNAVKLWKKLKQDDRLLPIYQKTNNYSGLLSIYEKARDFDSAVKILKKINDKSSLRTEAQQFFEKRKYFSALLRFYLLKDHANTAICYYRQKDYSQAGPYFVLAGLHYDAAIAFQKNKTYRKAFRHFLQSDEDRQDNFSRVKKIRYRLSFEELSEEAHRSMKENRMEAAAFCFSLIQNHLMAVTCSLEINQEDKASYYWSKCTFDLNLADAIAQYCLENNKVDFGAQFILKLDMPTHDPYWPNRGYLSESRFYLFQIMDVYFEQNPNREEMKKWIKVMDGFVADDNIIDKKLFYLEKSEDYNCFYKELNKINIFHDQFLSRLKHQYREQYLELVREATVLSAIKLDCIGKHDDVNRILKGLELTEDNYEIFAQSDRWEEVLELFLQKGKINRIKWMLVNKEQFLKLAQIYEELGILDSAAQYYGVANDNKKSGILYEGIEKYYKAGEAYYKAHSYQKALEMYQKSGKGKTKIAQTYEKLGDWGNAVKMWKELGKIKKAQKCMDKLQSLRLFD